jgi:hypothetical protein
MTPSQRARMDAAKIKAREEKRLAQGGIGPGSYEPRRPGSTSYNLCGSTAFKSTTPRASRDRQMGSDTIMRDSARVPVNLLRVGPRLTVRCCASFMNACVATHGWALLWTRHCHCAMLAAAH